MKKFIGFGSVALLVAMMLVLASCGGPSGNGSGNSDGSMEGMDHGESGSDQASGKEESTGGMSGMEGMDHGDMDMGSGGMASEMLMEDGEYSDERFIDSMVPHHRGAVDMAEVALENAEHPEIKNLAEDIVSSQEAEIEELRSVKEREFGTSEVPMEMSAEEMESMGMMMDSQELANQEPFDKAFIDNMIPHHESAIEMANVALQESDNPDIRQIAEAIVDAQKREIAQMTDWREKWYPEG